MKRTITKLISILIVTVTCFSMLPLEAFAWGKMTHVYTANLIEDETVDGSAVLNYPYDVEDSEKSFEYTIPEEYLEAIRAYPDMFRAGALGPDVYPDIITGQMYIHPEYDNIDSGEWVTLLCDSVNKMGKDTEGRKKALSFTLGCMLHYCGDLFGHDFVNTFSGGSFPSLMSADILDIEGERLNNVLSHLSVEKYMDNMIYPSYNADKDGGVDAPDEFVSNVMVFNGTPAAGLASPYEKYPAFDMDLDEIELELIKDILDDFYGDECNNVPPHYVAMLSLREYVIANADENREHMDPVSAAKTRYYDEWAADIDAGIMAFTKACDNIAIRMITKEKNPDIEKKKEEERNEDKNQFWDLSGKSFESMIEEYYPSQDPDKVKAAFEEVGIYGDSFFDMVLVELVADGVITMSMLKGTEGSSITIIKEEFDYWLDEYGVYMLGVPDIIIDGIDIPVIGDIIDVVILKPIWSWIGNEIKRIAADYVVATCTGAFASLTSIPAENVSREMAVLISKLNDRLEDPALQLDHADNPYKPSDNNFAQLEEYMKTLLTERRYSILDSNFEALYNTLTMFKLVLMGPDNYSAFIEANTGVKQTAYQNNTAHPEATSLRLEIKTSDLYLSGTNDNIYVILYEINENGSKTRLTRKLLDISGEDDFESGDTKTYVVELPRSVQLAKLEIGLGKTPAFDFLPSLTDDWFCENIRVTPLFSGYELTEPIDLGGIHLKGICESIAMNFQDALRAGRDPQNQKSQTVTNLKIQIKVKDELYAGSDSDIYLVAYNGDTRWAKICLDKALYNDLERNDNDTYMLPVTAVGRSIKGIPLDKLKIAFVHDGVDEANWEEVTVTPCYGSLELTSPLSLGGKLFEDSTWTPNLRISLRKAAYKQYEPVVLEYATILDDGLLSYMGSLDGGEEWVDSDNEMWANTSLRKDVFFEIFKGFAPEIDYTGEPTALQGDPVEIILELTGVWNGVSNDRRSKVKDFEYVSSVEGSADISIINEKGDVVYSASDVDVANGFVSHSIAAGKLEPGNYDLKVYYAPDEANPMYSDTEVVFERVLTVNKLEDLAIKTQPKDVTVKAGQVVTLTVAAKGGKIPYKYKWQVSESNGEWRDADGSWCIGYDGDTISFTARENGYGYRCVVTDSMGNSVVSDSAMVTVVKELAVTINDGQPSIQLDQSNPVNKTLTARVTGGVGPYTYRWILKRQYFEGWEVVSTTSTYEVDPYYPHVGASIKVEVTDSTGKMVTSNVVKVNVSGVIN